MARARQDPAHLQRVEFDEYGNPEGEGVARFTSFVGTFARSYASITIPTWPEVPQEIKKNIWNEVQARTTSLPFDVVICVNLT